MNEALTTALYCIIKSLVDLMFRNGIAFGDFSRLAKRAYIEVVENELSNTGQKTTTSRIAIITGLTRKDVAALRKEVSPKLIHTTAHNRATRVISGWISDEDFCNKKGKAKLLDVQGEQDSFEVLVSRHSGDIPYRAMLDELVRIDAVECTDTNQVKLLRTAYIPSNNENEMYALLGEDVSLLINTIKQNIITMGNGVEANDFFYQRKVCYEQIPVDIVAEFKKLANKENQLLLVKLNKWLAEHDEEHNSVSANAVKVGVGIYYFEDQPRNNKRI